MTQPTIDPRARESAPHPQSTEDRARFAPATAPAVEPAPVVDPDVQERLGLGQGGRRRWRRLLVWGVAALALLAAFVLWRARSTGTDGAGGYVTAPVERGDLAVTVTATGTLSAVDTVEVGSEVSGRVVAVHVDYNDEVRRGQVLATLDPEQAQASAQEAAAQVQAAAASLQRAQATAEESRVKLRRAEELAQSGLLSPQDLDTAQATARRAEADIASARAQATVAQAGLSAARSRLQKTEVLAPIDGIVLARSIEPGQTVAASLQAPVLFTLARDLREMTLKVDVDEADVGKVREGQNATFTVDAYPARVFPSNVISLRNVPKTDQSVVTYEAVLAVQNPDLALRPGMTGTATIRTEEKPDVLLVSNAALRFTPPEVVTAESGRRGGLFIPGVTRGSPWGRRNQQQRGGAGGAGAAGAGGDGQRAPGAAAAGRPAGAGQRAAGDVASEGRRGGAGAGPAASGAGGRTQSGAAGARQAGGAGGRRGAVGPGGAGGFGPGGAGGGDRVWVLRDGKPVPVPVVLGATDGSRTEIVDGELRPGEEVIVDVQTPPEARL
jgi:HlyD family secretion protein